MTLDTLRRTSAEQAAKASRAKKAFREALKKADKMAPKLANRPPAPKDDGEAYMAWQHADGLSCIACLIEGYPDTRGEPNPIEVAHQKRNDPRWRSQGLGKRAPHAQSCPLCRWHHQLAPNACDKAQGKFWDRLGIDVVAYCAALYGAFRADEAGEIVVRMFALMADGKVRART